MPCGERAESDNAAVPTDSRRSALTIAVLTGAATLLGLVAGVVPGTNWKIQLGVGLSCLAVCLVAARRWPWLEQRLDAVGSWILNGKRFYASVTALTISAL